MLYRREKIKYGIEFAKVKSHHECAIIFYQLLKGVNTYIKLKDVNNLHFAIRCRNFLTIFFSITWLCFINLCRKYTVFASRQCQVSINNTSSFKMSSKCDFCGRVGTLQLSNNISAAKYPPLTAKNAGQTLMVLRKMFDFRLSDNRFRTFQFDCVF